MKSACVGVLSIIDMTAGSTDDLSDPLNCYNELY